MLSLLTQSVRWEFITYYNIFGKQESFILFGLRINFTVKFTVYSLQISLAPTVPKSSLLGHLTLFGVIIEKRTVKQLVVAVLVRFISVGFEFCLIAELNLSSIYLLSYLLTVLICSRSKNVLTSWRGVITVN